MYLYIAIAIGGSIGALGRYTLMSLIGQMVPIAFPWGTLTVNIFGALVLGLLVEFMALKWSPSPEIRAFIIVGLLGAFTTFSAFTLDLVLMLERGRWAVAIGYVLVSTLGCLLTMWLAMRSVRWWLG